MLAILFHNDGTGDGETGNYDVLVKVNHKVIWSGRVENHTRIEGWEELLKQLIEIVEG